MGYLCKGFFNPFRIYYKYIVIPKQHEKGYFFSSFADQPYFSRSTKWIPDIANLTDLDYEYIGLFYTKIEDYLNRNDYVVLQPKLNTKVIIATADKLNIKTEIFLDKRLLEKIVRFEDLL